MIPQEHEHLFYLKQNTTLPPVVISLDRIILYARLGLLAAPFWGRMSDRYDGYATMPIDDQAHASAGGVVSFTIDWPEASVAVESRLQVRSDPTEFTVEIELDAFESGIVVAERRWSQRFPRQLA